MRVTPELDIIFEDNHLLVVNKPALLPTMGAERGRTSLLDLAKEHIGSKYGKPGNVYLGVVSRLDAFVSGVIVLARTSKAAARLNQQFANSWTEKKYIAIVPAERCQASADLEHWLLKDEANHRMMTVNRQQMGAKNAQLRYLRMGQFENLNLIEVNLLTGRKHQIRVQLAASGLPIAGDRKYGSRIPFQPGIALHSRSLTIEHPTLKTKMTFTSRPPDYWKLDRFR